MSLTPFAAALLNSFAAGDMQAVKNFNFTSTEGALAKAAAEQVPGLRAFSEAFGSLMGKAAGLQVQAQEACKE